MAEFRGQRITNAGRNLLGRALAKEGKFIFTKAKMGDKKIIGNPDEATDLASPKLDMKIIDVSNDQGTVKVIVSVTNKDLQESFNTEEFGLFAKIDGDLQDVMYSYATAIRPDGIPNNHLGVTLEQVHEIYLTFSSDIEATININDPLLYMTAAIANKRYVPTGLLERGELSKQTQLEEDCQYLASDGKWYHNIGGNRKWNSTGNPDEKLVHISWKTLISLYQKIKEKLSNLKLTWESIENKPENFPPSQHEHEEYEPKINSKKSAFNLDKTSSIENAKDKLFTAAGAYNLNKKKWDISYGTDQTKGIEDGNCGIFIGGGNEINFEMSGTDVVFNYRPKKNGKSIERFLFLNGTRTNNGAEIRAGRIYQNDKEVANVDGSQYDKQQIAGAYSGNGGKQPPSYVGSGKVRFLMSNVSNNGNYDYKDYMYMDTYVGSDVPVVTAFGITKSNNLKAFIMSGPKGGSYWAREAELWTTLNFDPNNKISISSISTSISDSSTTNVASAYLTNWLYQRAVVDLRLAARTVVQTPPYATTERNGTIVTGTVNIRDSGDDKVGSIIVRTLQMRRNESWVNVPFV